MNRRLKFLFLVSVSSLLWIILIACVSYAQEELVREPQEEEFISLNRDLPLSTALDIISQLSFKYENKIITDSQDHSEPIGVVVDHMHWKRALEYILKTNGLSYKEHARHYEIIDDEATEVADKLRKTVDLETREIEIKATFFEADYATMAQMGIDWSTLHNGKVKLRADSRAGSQVDGALFSAKVVSTKFIEVAAIINAFESRDKGRLIANPQIRIMDGEEGKIKVGKNFYLTTKDFSGNTRYSEYEAGTILRVTPKIINVDGETFIHLDINAEKSDVDVTSLGVTKKITEGKTKVLLLNKEETALAGMFSNQVTVVRKGIPVLKDLPWWFLGLRYLMGYDAKNYSKKELIILIKAEIVPSLKNRNLQQESIKQLLERRRKEYERNKNNFSFK